MTTCAVGPCEQPRVEGSSYCPKHGPTATKTKPSRAVGPAAIICPHCQTRGKVTTKRIKQAGPLSGKKAAGGLVSGGATIFVTGLRHKNKVTQAHCRECGVTWVMG